MAIVLTPNNNFDIAFSPKLIYYGLAVIVLLWLASGIYIVRAAEQAIVLQFGRSLGYELAVLALLQSPWADQNTLTNSTDR